MKVASLTLLIFLCLDFDGGNAIAQRIVQVYNITCNPEYQAGCESKSLKTILNEIQEGANVEIHIQISHLDLTTDLNFTNLNSLIISGPSVTTTITCTATGNFTAGLVMNDINGTLILKNLNLISCGTLVKEKLFKRNVMYSSALSLIHCMNVEITNVVISRSRGLGMIIFDHQGGRVNVTSTVFKENTMVQDCAKDVYGGGGLYLSQRHNPQGYTRSRTFLFENCTFESNIGRTKVYKSIYNDILGVLRNGYGRGGGAYVNFHSGSRNIHLSFVNCKFTGNLAFIGGGLSLNINGRKGHVTRNVTIEVKDSLFQKNGCYKHDHNETGFGGGANIAFKSGLANCHYLIKNVTFNNNCAELGGGIFYYSYRGRQETLNDTNSLLFDSCTFEQNRAHMGSAVAMTPYSFLKVSSGYTIIPTFQNCNFRYNKVFVKYAQSQKTQRIGGIGTLYSSLYDISFKSVNSFESNFGTAIHSVNGIVNVVNSDMSFVNNSGIQGGAISLVGTSTLNVGRKNYEFINNTAINKGGAIHVLLMDSIDFISSRSCFIQYTGDDDSTTFSRDWNINMTFKGNRAIGLSAGHAIYATSLHPCQVVKNGSIAHHDFIFVKASDVFTSQGVTFDDDPLLQPQIATDGDVLFTTKPTPLMIIPGEEYSHGVVVMDDLGRHINAAFRVFISKKQQSNKSLFISSKYVTDKIQLTGNPHQVANLNLWHTSPRRNYITLDVKLVDCPPGFKLNKKLTCVCDARAHFGKIQCDLDNFHSHLLPGYWAGTIKTVQNSSELVTCRCPFCHYSRSESGFEIILPKNTSDLTKTVCGDTREGIVCGKCREGYTVHFHSPGYLCKPAEPAGCKLGWLFYILSELVPVTVVFIAVLVLNISFTSGAVNGFILYGQLLNTFNIDASGIITFPESAKHGIKKWTECYQIIYGFVNLDFFNSEPFSFCLRKHASALDMIALKYVTILYTLLLLATVILIINKCGGKCCGKCCRITTIKTSVVHGISTFLVVCYTQCVKVSLDLLIPVWLVKKGVKPHARVWLNGEILYFGREHLPYALPALFCLVTIALVPPFLLLAYPLTNKIISYLGCNNCEIVKLFSNCKVFSISNLKPLLDSIQGCFKDNMRFFAGLYFLYRWAIPFIHVFANGFGMYYSVLGALLLVILTVHAMCQPYIKRAHNIVDTLLLADLVIINSLSFINYYQSQTQWDSGKVAVAPAIVQLILIYLPLMVMAVYVILATFKKIVYLLFRNSENRLGAVDQTNHFDMEKSSTLREILVSLSIKVEPSKKEEEDIFYERMDD